MNPNELVPCPPDEIVWLRNLDGTGSMHVCTPHDEGATKYVLATEPAQDYEAAWKKLREYCTNGLPLYDNVVGWRTIANAVLRAAEAEQQIVAWLREQERYWNEAGDGLQEAGEAYEAHLLFTGASAYREAARIIERGEHRKKGA